MAENCINYYYSCQHIYKAFRASDTVFWFKHTSPVIAMDSGELYKNF